MPAFRRTLRVPVPAAELFAWHERPGAFERLAAPWQRVEVLHTDGRLTAGARVELRAGVAPRALDTARYAEAYRSVGLPRLRRRQIDLVGEVGQRLDAVVQRHGVGKLLSSARLPARLLGLQHLQGFLERGFAAFSRLGGAGDFLARIDRQERCIARRLAVGAEEPFAPPFS